PGLPVPSQHREAARVLGVILGAIRCQRERPLDRLDAGAEPARAGGGDAEQEVRVGVPRLAPQHLLACSADACGVAEVQAPLGLPLQAGEILRRIDLSLRGCSATLRRRYAAAARRGISA